MVYHGASERTFLAASALLFAVSATVTIVWCASMAAMAGMPMPGVLWRPDGDPPDHGVMDLRAMAVVTAAITFERLAPSGERAARLIGGVVIVAGLVQVARAAGLA
jgi:hypothetical protein